LTVKFYLKEALITIYFASGYQSFADRILELGWSPKGAAFVFLFVLTTSAIFLLSYTSNLFLRLTYAIIIFLSSSFLLSYEIISGSNLSYSSFIGLMYANGFIFDVFDQYLDQILLAVISSLLLFIAIAIKPRVINQRLLLLFKISWIGILVLLTCLLFLRGGDGAKGLHTPLLPISYSVLAAYETWSETPVEREEVSLTLINKHTQNDIILIMDESISPNYLDINSDFGVTSNLKLKPNGGKIFNFGYAAAIANCSYAVNYTLRHGGTRNNYVEINAKMPSIWQYAKKAGYKTIYIDTQRTNAQMQNGMTLEELGYVDEFIQYDGMPVVSRDIAAASTLVEKINNNEREFILINKIGAHFPIHDKYPDNFLVYKPVLKRGLYKDITDTGSREGFSGTQEDWMLYRNAYRNTILWGVGNFFKTIFSQSILNNAVIIYTSDHGQNLHENGTEGTNTHCSPQPIMEEGMVPLVIIQGDKVKTLNWQTHLAQNIDHSSAYNIFPTLLKLMHYEKNEINKVYGQSLDEKINDKMTFNALFHARLGKKPQWIKIEPSLVTIPTEAIIKEPIR